MRGVTKEIALPFTFRAARAVAGDEQPVLNISVRWELNRNDFGVGSTFRHTLMENFLGDKIALEIDLGTRLPKKAE